MAGVSVGACKGDNVQKKRSASSNAPGIAELLFVSTCSTDGKVGKQSVFSKRVSVVIVDG